MTRVNIDVSTYMSREPDPDDDWDRGDSDGHIDRVYISEDEYGWGYRGEETDLEPPFYVVYASYYTGNTFGSDFEACVVGVVKTVEEAQELSQEAEKFEGFGDLSNGFYVPWNGYFEHLISVDYERLS